MKTLLRNTSILILVMIGLQEKAQISFTVTNLSGPNVINCGGPGLQFQATSTVSGVTYNWTGPGLNTTGSNVIVSSPGSYTVLATAAGNNSTTQTFNVSSGTTTLSATVSPLSQTVGCSAFSATQVTVTASYTNCSYNFVSAYGGSLITNGNAGIYLPSPGTHTCIVTDNITGCSVSVTIAASTFSGNPTFNLASPNNFSLGCNSASTAVINIYNGNTVPQGGPVSFTLLSPGSSTTLPSGVLSSSSSYTVSAAGTYTAIVRDNTSLCTTQTPFTISQNTVTPNISVTVPQQILDCNTPSVSLKAHSNAPITSYLWTFPGTPGALLGDSITVNVTNVPSQTLIANYSLTATDINNMCESDTVIQMLQNTFKPNTAISGPPLSSCQGTAVLTNASTSGIPNGIFPNSAPVVGLLWEGPSPHPTLALSTTYLAHTPGQYTLTAKDMNNGCIKSTTFNYTSAPEAAFTHTIAGGTATFANTILVGGPGGISYFWNFGDGNTSTLNNPTHTYVNSGSYLVKLKITWSNGSCSDSIIQSVNITGVPCVANSNFTMVPTGTTQIWNVIPNYPWNVTAASWNWGDGSTSGTLYTSHQYSAAGMYNICLSVTVSCGDTSTTCTTYSVYRASQEALILEVNIVAPELVTGLESQESNELVDWSIFPNPNSGEFKLNHASAEPGPMRLMISDLTGRLVFDRLIEPGSGTSTLNADLLPGMYLVTLEVNNQKTTKRMIISH